MAVIWFAAKETGVWQNISNILFYSVIPIPQFGLTKMHRLRNFNINLIQVGCLSLKTRQV